MSADARALTLVRQAATGAEPGLVMADDGNAYWVKAQGNQHGPTSLLSERVVGLAGEWLGAPVAPSRLIELPDAIAASWKLQSGQRVTPGLAHGSMVVTTQAVEQVELTHHKKDGNASRGPAYVALWEWCLGEDEQFIYDSAKSMTVWSIDHGLWIGGGGQWDMSFFTAPPVPTPRWPGPVKDLSRSAFLAAADRLDSFTLSDAQGIAQAVPLEWGFTTTELATVADWLFARAALVAARLRVLSVAAQKD